MIIITQASWTDTVYEIAISSKDEGMIAIGEIYPDENNQWTISLNSVTLCLDDLRILTNFLEKLQHSTD